MDATLANDKWETLFTYSIVPGDGSQKTTLGTRSPRNCMFCSHGDATTTFRSDAHVIAAAFGNRSLFSFDECDDCNQYGSKLEDDLAKFLSMPRAISRLPGRKGSPKIRDPRHQSYITSRSDENLVHIFQPTNEDSIQLDDDGHGTLTLTVQTPKHRPINVARALGRMMMFGLPRDYPHFDNLRRWVVGETEWYPVPLIILHIPGAGYRRSMILGHRYSPEPNRYILRISFMYSSFLLTMPLPIDRWDMPAGVTILNYPDPIVATLIANTSSFLIRDEEPDPGGSSTVTITYQQCNLTSKDTSRTSR